MSKTIGPILSPPLSYGGIVGKKLNTPEMKAVKKRIWKKYLKSKKGVRR